MSTENNSPRYEAALRFATEKHAGQMRIGGDPYITHPVTVAGIVREWGYGEEHQIAALFHDLLEDTDATEDEIRALGGDRVLDAVKRLTKAKDYDMAEYVESIKENEISKAVKAADRLHNLRCAIVTNDNFKRKYVLETIDWYMGFSPEIAPAVRALAASMEQRITELSFLYEPIETWKISPSEE